LWWYQADYDHKKFVEVYKENGTNLLFLFAYPNIDCI